MLVVSEEHSPQHLLPTIVLSTPLMINAMEQVCTRAVWDHLDDDETTVGTHVDVYHRAAARDGDEVILECELRSVEGKRLLFDVTARTGDVVVGDGSHERYVVDRSRFSR